MRKYAPLVLTIAYLAGCGSPDYRKNEREFAEMATIGTIFLAGPPVISRISREQGERKLQKIAAKGECHEWLLIEGPGSVLWAEPRSEYRSVSLEGFSLYSRREFLPNMLIEKDSKVTYYVTIPHTSNGNPDDTYLLTRMPCANDFIRAKEIGEKIGSGKFTGGKAIGKSRRWRFRLETDYKLHEVDRELMSAYKQHIKDAAPSEQSVKRFLSGLKERGIVLEPDGMDSVLK